MKLLQAGIHFYITGIFILTLGIALAIVSTLGTSPFDALLVGLYRTFGLSIGSWEFIVGFMFFLGNAIAEKKPQYFALITAFITGVGIDFWLYILNNWFVPTSLIGQWICLILYLAIAGLGTAIYLQSQIAPNPMDRTMVIISTKTGLSVTYSRTIINIVLVLIAFAFNGDIGIGTVVITLFAGYFIKLFLPFAENMKRRTLTAQQNQHVS